MKAAWIGLSVLVFGTACAQLGQLVSYTIGEDELASLALGQLQSSPPQVEVLGARATVDVDDLDVRIAPDDDGRVHLRLDSTVKASAFGQAVPVKSSLMLSGIPRYSSQDHAIFVERIRLDDSFIETGIGSFNVSGISDQLYQYADNWLADNPVYRFDPEDSRYALLHQLGLDIVVEPGRLRLQSAE